MSPPSEQVVRDYLNHLSMVARHDLNATDRQVLLDQVRTRIESESGGIRRASPGQIRMILAGLGDPVAVVESARVRFAAGSSRVLPAEGTGRLRGPAASAWPESAVPDQSGISPGHVAGPGTGHTASLTGGLGTWSASEDRAAHINSGRAGNDRTESVATRAQRGDLLVVGDSSAGMGGDVPRPARSPENPPPEHEKVARRDGEAPETEAPESAEPARVAADLAHPDSLVPRKPAAAAHCGEGTLPSAGETAESPRPSAPSARSAMTGQEAASETGLPSQRPWPVLVGREDFAPESAALAAPTRDGESGAGHEAADDEPPRSPAPEPPESAPPSWWPRQGSETGAARGRRGRSPARFVAGLTGFARAHKLESVAIVLLGIGGAIFPPAWLLGALLALPLRKWDIRDKLISLVLPIFLLIVGTVAIVVFGGEHGSLGGYLREAWRGAVFLSRALALLSAGYLAVRSHRGRRDPREPPWNVPRRLG